MEALGPRFEVHRALENENGERRGVAGAEVHYGVGGKCAARTVSED